ncbi:unnamed protein product [Protopolystoma xenopodis]|uniref:EGF-like domain-containing protein n=1 Tax=Protopolystoma xenopodis TaxID=117903 RepID=A0A3S5CE19_9PLAT|nr:unnamed protein product [Protopolystoma xenopodis]
MAGTIFCEGYLEDKYQGNCVLDVCADRPDYCQHKGVCVAELADGVTTPSCVCPEGFTGQRCEKLLPPNWPPTTSYLASPTYSFTLPQLASEASLFFDWPDATSTRQSDADDETWPNLSRPPVTGTTATASVTRQGYVASTQPRPGDAEWPELVTSKSQRLRASSTPTVTEKSASAIFADFSSSLSAAQASDRPAQASASFADDTDWANDMSPGEQDEEKMVKATPIQVGPLVSLRQTELHRFFTIPLMDIIGKLQPHQTVYMNKHGRKKADVVA